MFRMFATFNFVCYLSWYMKRILTIFLVLWLPLFMQSAWAMSTHMALQGTRTTIDLKVHQDVVSESCHHYGEKTDTQQVTHRHHCAHCLACAISMASASFDGAPRLYLPEPAQENASSVSAQYFSVHLPAAIKPPIST